MSTVIQRTDRNEHDTDETAGALFLGIGSGEGVAKYSWVDALDAAQFTSEDEADAALQEALVHFRAADPENTVELRTKRVTAKMQERLAKREEALVAREAAHVERMKAHEERLVIEADPVRFRDLVLREIADAVLARRERRRVAREAREAAEKEAAEKPVADPELHQALAALTAEEP